MTKTILSFIAALAALVLVQTVHAASHADTILEALMAARKSLLAMIDAPDTAAQDKLYADLTMASQRVDDTLIAALNDKATPEDQAAKLKQFREIWGAFKETRETKIVPAVREGKKDDARAIAKGVQAERMTKMRALLAELGAK